MNLQEIREKNPQYSDMTDWELATRMHSAHYNDMPFDEFAGKIGFKESKIERALGRFGQTVAAFPSNVAATVRTFKQADDPEKLKGRLPEHMYRGGGKPDPHDKSDPRPYAERYREWHEASLKKTNATDDAYKRLAGPNKKAVDKEARRLVKDNGWTKEHARTEAVIAHMQENKSRVIEVMQRVEQIFSMPKEYQERSSGFLEDVFGGLATTAVSMPAFIAHPVLGYATVYGQLHGTKVQELEAAGVEDPELILKSAIVSAGIQTPLEAAGNLFMISRILKAKGTWSSALVNIAESMGGEGLTEFVQQYPDEFATMMALNPDLTTEELIAAFTERLPEISGEGVYAGLVGAVAGGGTTTVGITANQALKALVTDKQKKINAARSGEVQERQERARKVVTASVLDYVRAQREQKTEKPLSEIMVKVEDTDVDTGEMQENSVPADEALAANTQRRDVYSKIMECMTNGI